jgi:hypothetical protein
MPESVSHISNLSTRIQGASLAAPSVFFDIDRKPLPLKE